MLHTHVGKNEENRSCLPDSKTLTDDPSMISGTCYINNLFSLLNLQAFLTIRVFHSSGEQLLMYCQSLHKILI